MVRWKHKYKKEGSPQTVSEFEQPLLPKTTELEAGTEHEVPLYGGNVTGATRIGQTVRRTTGPWSTTVHTLLRHLEKNGFIGAPRFLGIDEQ